MLVIANARLTGWLASWHCLGSHEIRLLIAIRISLSFVVQKPRLDTEPTSTNHCSSSPRVRSLRSLVCDSREIDFCTLCERERARMASDGPSSHSLNSSSSSDGGNFPNSQSVSFRSAKSTIHAANVAVELCRAVATSLKLCWPLRFQNFR